MRHLHIAIVLLFIFLIGCSHTKIIKTTELEHATPLPKNYTIQRVQLTLSNGEKRVVKKLFISPDSTTYFDTEKGEDIKIATSDISSVQHKNQVKGALIGTGTGLLVGVTYGHLTRPNKLGSIEEALGVDDAYSIRTMMCGGAGGLVGFLLGNLIGVKTTYDFQTIQNHEQLENVNNKNLEHINKE